MSVRKLFLEELNRVGREEYREIPKVPAIVVLDNIRSGMNIGSVFRTCDAFSIEKVILTGISATPPHKEILKAGLGANETVEWEYYSRSEDAVIKLKERGYKCIGIEQTDKSIMISDYTFEFPLAIIMGNEVSGISDELLDLMDDFVEIPQFGTKHSLNVAVCAGIVLWELAKKYKQL